MADIKKFAEELVNLTVKEVQELAQVLKEYGIEPAAAAAVAVAAPAAGGAAAEAEQTQFDVILTSAGQAKLQIVKVVKEITGLGLKEAKELVDKVPAPVKEKVSKAEAEQVKAQLEEAGGEVEPFCRFFKFIFNQNRTQWRKTLTINEFHSHLPRLFSNIPISWRYS